MSLDIIATFPVYFSCPDARGTPKLRWPRDSLRIANLTYNDKIAYRIANAHNPKVPRTLVVTKSHGRGGSQIVAESENFSRTDLHQLGPCSQINSTQIMAALHSTGEIHIEIPRYVKFENAESKLYKPIPQVKTGRRKLRRQS